MSDSKTLEVKVVGNIGSFEGDMNRAGAATDQFGEKATQAGGKHRKSMALSATSARTLGRGMVVVGGAISAVGIAAMKTGISYNTLQQKSRAALTTLLGGAKQANAQMDKLDDFAKNSPFAKQVFIKAQQQLIGFGFAAKDVIPTLDAIQNAVAAVGGSNEDIESIATVLAKVKSQGKLTAMTLRELGTRGIDAASIIGDEMGKTGQQIRSSITAGSLDADKALTALTDGMQKKFGGAAANVKRTAAGAFDRVSAAWRDLSSDLAEPFVSKKGGGLFVDLLNQTADLMRLFQALPGPIKTGAAALTFLGGAALLAGGAFLLMRPKIAAMKVALIELMTVTGATSISLQSLNKGMLLKNGLKGAAMLGAVALSTSGLTEKFKAADVAQYALMGAMLGPWGAAIGAGAGLMKVMSQSTRDADAAFQAMLATAGDTSNLKKHNDMLEQLTAQSKMLKSDNGVKSFFKDQIADIDEARESSRQYQFSLQKLEDVIAGGNDGINELFDPKKMQDFADKVGPILEGVGIDIEKVLEAGPKSKLWKEAVLAIQDYQAEMDSAAGRSAEFDAAMAATDDSMVSAADAAKGLDAALGALFNPQMNLDKATIAWKESLRSLQGQLTGGTNAIDINTVAGQKNRTAVMGTVNALKENIVAMAGAGQGAEEIMPKFEQGRNAIMRAGVAAGLTKKQMNTLLREYGLTPELVETLVKQKGAEHTKSMIQQVINKMNEADGKHATVTLTSRQKTIVSTFVNPPSGSTGTLKQMLTGNQADGGFYPHGIPAAADGLINDAHIARAGSGVRMIRYAESETQGEAFIPFAQNKRKRSTQILSETAERFGYDLAPRGRELVTASRGAPSGGNRGPMIGQLTVPALKREDAEPMVAEIMYQTRRIERGGRWA